MSDEKTEQKKACCLVHPMYDTALCENAEGHDGLHRTFHQGEWLRWGVPSQKERYDVIRTKG